MTVAVNRAPFADPRPATAAERLTRAEHEARAARLRMSALCHDMAIARLDFERGDEDALLAMRRATADYRAEYQRHLLALAEVSSLRAKVGAATVDAFAPYAPRPAAGELREVAP